MQDATSSRVTKTEIHRAAVNLFSTQGYEKARFQLWLAGPNPTAADRLRASAAVESIGAAMSAELQLPTRNEEIRAVLLDSATAILTRRGMPVDE